MKVKEVKEIFHHLHQYKYLWRACTKRETIIKAWKKLRKGKTRRREVIRIEKDFEYYVGLMEETLLNTRPEGDPEKEFKPEKLKPRLIVEHGKVRQIFAPKIWEQWIHHIIIQVLSPIVMKYAYKFSCGSMPKRGGVYGKKEIARVIKKKGFKYFVKLDIRHFFNSIELDVVVRELEVFVDDNWFIYLIRKVFENFPKGLPLGFYISQWLANFVLGRVDALISRFKPVCFVRYVDDFIIADNNKQFLHGLIKKIAKRLGKLHLRLKKNYQVIRFMYEKKDGKKIGRGIDFMGYYFDREHVILRKRVLIKATRTARRLKKLTVIGLRQAQGMLSRLGWFKHTQTKKAYLDYIQPNISIGSLKNIVRRNSRRMLRYENSVVRRTAWISAIAV